MKKHRQRYVALILGFLLGIQNGKIALWKTGQAQTTYVFPYRADTLPPEIQTALQSGIPIQTPEELEALIENYLS